MTPLQVFVDGIGLFAPGLNGWQHASAVLAAPHTYRVTPLQLPDLQALPAAERRRLGLVVKLAMAAGHDAVQQSSIDPLLLSTVFSSCAGDGDNCHHILEALASPDRAISPTRFHNSVHNAAAGYWHIATHSRQPSISLSAHDAGFGAALLETVSQVCVNTHPCLLVAFDTPSGPPLQDMRSIAQPFGVAMLLTSKRLPSSVCGLTLSLTEESAHRMPNANLEAMRCDAPAARALPLLSALAMQQPHAVIEYLQGLNISIMLQP